MNWKIFTTACISTLFISFPYNIIGCGYSVDAYDYYTTFFNADIVANTALRPFYYTAYADLYDSQEPVNPADVLAEEWKNYAGVSVTINDAKAFVTEYDVKDINNLYNYIEKNQLAILPEKVKQNSLTKYFIQQKDYEALGYIIYAKKVEPLVIATPKWEAKVNDVAAMEKLIRSGLQLYTAAKTDFFKLKYGYQITKLALYSGKNNDGVKYYDALVAPTKTKSVLQPMALSLKAGALYKIGKHAEAAYLYSKAFASSDAKKISNFVSFKWAVQKGNGRNDYLQLCKTNKERADMLALFALSSIEAETKTIQEIYTLDSQNKNIETLIARDINKIEDNYFTPILGNKSGGKQNFYISTLNENDEKFVVAKQQLKDLQKIVLKIAEAPKQTNALYYTSAAYCSFMMQNYTEANQFLSNANKLKPVGNVKGQWMLTNLLVIINEATKITTATETTILPSLQWLKQKATIKIRKEFEGQEYDTWKIFYRNVLSVALAKKYHAQGDIFKETLCVASAEKIFSNYNYNSLEFLRNNTDINDVEKLYAFFTSKNTSAFDAFIINNNALTTADIIDFAGTSYLRNYDYEHAIKWLQKSGANKKDTIYKSAFIELLKDVEEKLPTETRTTSKLLFAQEMLATQNLAKTEPTKAANHYYKLATGMYNITYYGHAWELVQYYRSGSDGYQIPKNATSFQKQYYGCYAAHDMYKKAMDASADKNFKGKCLFMMAKCSQKTAGKKYGYDEPGYTYEKSEIAQIEFMKNFKNNKYFAELSRDYKGTPFYEEAYSRCSYLKDFVQKNK